MPHEIDTHVGEKLRQFRWLAGLNQTQLAEKMGVKFQQVQKYETGTNRISASRLWMASEALDKPIAAFFPQPEGEAPAEQDEVQDRIDAKLLRRIKDLPDNKRTAVVALIQTFEET